MTESFRAFAVSVAGAAAAWLWFGGFHVWVFAIVIVPLLAGSLLFAWGRSLLPYRPVEAAGWMGFGVLVPLAAAVGASTATIVLTVGFERLKSWPEEQQKVIAALGGAATGILASVVTIGDDKKGVQAWVGKRIKAVFHKTYDSKTGQIRFRAGSAAELAVFSEHWKQQEGWGTPKARAERAYAIQAALQAKDYVSG